MGVINILDYEVSNLIAAGEVVDRPASVVKELLENALDSGATSVTVETKNGGIAFIRVADNGRGMSREDVPVCIKRHATSKIRRAADLDGIMTLGFRGEALAAIASVSKLRIITKTRDAEMGTLMSSESGTVTEIGEAGCPDGTTVIVEELFRNVPARRKFLKRDMTETMAAAAVVEKIALSRPDIAVKLICDGTQRFATSGDGKAQNAVYAILGKEFTKKLISVRYMTEGVEIGGFIGSPDNTRGNRNFQNFFLNGRYIKSKIIMSALEQAFNSYIPSERFPSCVLYITLHPAYVDVNVHPAKIEVKFSDDKTVFNAVYGAVRNALTQGVNRPSFAMPGSGAAGNNVARDSNAVFGIPESAAAASDAAESGVAAIRAAQTAKLVNAFAPIPDRSQAEKGGARREIPDLFADYPPDNPDGGDVSGGVGRSAYYAEISTLPGYKRPPSDGAEDKFYFYNEEAPPEDYDGILPTEIITERVVLPQYGNAESSASPEAERAEGAETDSSPDAAATAKPPRYRIIGEAYNTYVFAELDDGLLIIDKHAAHERIIFEQMKEWHKRGGVYSQVLLLPVEVQLNTAEYSALLEYAADVEATGIGFEPGGGEIPKVNITRLPVDIDANSAAEIVVAMAGQLAEGRGNPALTREITYERALYQAACKAAVKAGERNAESHLRWICDRVLTRPEIRYCPHGRPVAFELTKSDIEHQFKRT